MKSGVIKSQWGMAMIGRCARVALHALLTLSASIGEGRATQAVPPQATDDDAQMNISGFRGTVAAAGRSKDGKRLSVAILVENVSDTELRIALIGPSPLATDSEGGDFQFKSFSGAGQCQSVDVASISYCLNNTSNYLPQQSYTRFLPGSKTTLNFAFVSEQGSSGAAVSFSATFALLTFAPKLAPSNANPVSTKADPPEQSTVGFGISNIRLAKHDE